MPRRNPARPRYRAAAVDTPTLVQFVVLSILLPVLLIVLFGNPPGGARRNEGWWGPLDVTLGPRLPEPGFRLAPGLETNAPSSLLPSGGATNAPGTSAGRATQPAAGSPAPVEALPRLNPSTPEEVNKALAPPVLSPEPIERIAPPERSREIAPPLELPLPTVPVLPAAPIERAVVPGSEPRLAPPVEMPPRMLPVVPTAPLQRAAPPTLERELAPAVEVPAREKPAAPTAPLEQLAPPAPIEPRIAPPVELPQREEPVAPTAPLQPLAPRTLEHELAPAVEAPTAPAERPAAPIAPSAPTALPAEQQPAQPFGKPEATEEPFKPRRDVAPSPAEVPHIDLDAARKKAAREVVSEGGGSRGVFTIPPPPPVERKSKDATALEKAMKPDCRNAYANMGLLAVPVLVASAIAADGSCRW